MKTLLFLIVALCSGLAFADGQRCPDDWSLKGDFEKWRYEKFQGKCVVMPPLPKYNRLMDPKGDCDSSIGQPVLYRRCISILQCEQNSSKLMYEACMADVR